MLSYETSLTQVRCVIGQVREMLYSHSRIEQESARSLNPIRENVFLCIAEIAEEEGAVSAIPSQLTLFSKETSCRCEKSR